MKFNCNTTILLQSLDIISKAIAARTPMPILKGILLESEGNGILKLSASDLDITIEKNMEASILEEGKIVVPAKFFRNIVRSLPGETVEFSTSDSSIHISSLNSEFDIIGMNADEFPSIKNIEVPTEKITINSKSFSEMISRTYFAASSDATKTIFTGVYTELGTGYIRMVAVDGFRIAICERSAINEKESNVTIPADMMKKIKEIVDESGFEKDVEVIIGEKSAVFLLDDTKVVVKIFNKPFIEYNSLIPANEKVTVKVDRKNFIKVIERASLVSQGGKHNLVKLSIMDNIMNISSTTEEGRVSDDILIEKEGENLEIGFNARYILDVLKVLDDDIIVMKLIDSVSFGLIEPEDGECYKYILCPVRLSGN